MTLESADRDAEHLRLLSIFHYVVAGLMALWACFPLIHLFMGVALVFLFIVRSTGEKPTLGDFTAFVASIGLLYPPIKAVTRLHNQLHQAAAASLRLSFTSGSLLETNWHLPSSSLSLQQCSNISAQSLQTNLINEINVM